MRRNLFLFPSIAGLFLLVPCLVVLGQDSSEKQAQELAKEAQQYVQSKQIDQARTAIKKAIQLAPKNPLFLALAGDIEMKAESPATALEYARQAIKLNDKVGAFYNLAAFAALCNRDLDQAREYCEEVLRRGPKEFAEAATTPSSFRNSWPARLTPFTGTSIRKRARW